MSEPDQIASFDDQPKDRLQRQVVYVPPTPDAIDHYAYAVCKQLGQGDDEQRRNTAFVREFASFMKVVVRITAKHLNKGADVCQTNP